MPTSRAGRSTESGFTLVELLVVVLLLGLLLGLVVPRLPSPGASELETAGQRIASLVRHLWNEAALTGREHRLRLDLETGRVGGWRLETDGALVPLTGSGGDRALPGAVRLLDVLPVAGGKQTLGRVEVRIFAAGWLDETVLHLAGDDGRLLTLHLQPLTGLADIHDGYREF